MYSSDILPPGMSLVSHFKRAAPSAMICSALFLAPAPPGFAQQASPPPDASSQKPVEQPLFDREESGAVTGKLTPAESEEWKIDQVYRPIRRVQRSGDCQTAIQRYKTELIPLAEHAQYDPAKYKFLYLANFGIGDCSGMLRDFATAEDSFQKCVEYLPNVPDKTDSDLPIVYGRLGMTYVYERRFPEAEATLKSAVSALDALVDAAQNSPSGFDRSQKVGQLRGLRAVDLIYLATAYLRESRAAPALSTAELAYADALAPNVPQRVVLQVVDFGNHIAQESGDPDAIAKWSQRK